MAYQLSLLLSVQSRPMAEIYQSLLERETRPIFEDEVDTAHRAAFKVIDEIEYPSYSTLDDKMLALIWYEVDNLEFEDVYPLSQLDGVGLLAAYEIPDDPMSWDEDVSNGWFWLPTANKVQQASYTEGKGMIPDLIEKLQVPE